MKMEYEEFYLCNKDKSINNSIIKKYINIDDNLRNININCLNTLKYGLTKNKRNKIDMGMNAYNFKIMNKKILFIVNYKNFKNGSFSYR